MTTTTAYHQIGKFIALFQHVEQGINEILLLLTKADSEAIRILINELEYSKRLKAADVMFSRFIDLMPETDVAAKAEFHKLMTSLNKLGERRNDIVHSSYTNWVNIEGRIGLIRENSKLRGKKGIREEEEEELLPEAFSTDFENLSSALHSLEKFRLRIIDWLYPELQSEPGV